MCACQLNVSVNECECELSVIYSLCCIIHGYCTANHKHLNVCCFLCCCCYYYYSHRAPLSLSFCTYFIPILYAFYAYNSHRYVYSKYGLKLYCVNYYGVVELSTNPARIFDYILKRYVRALRFSIERS